MAVKKTFEFFFAPLLKKFFQDMGRDPNNLEMIILRQKAGQLLKDSNKVIQFPQKESFMKQVEAMKRSGDLVDKDNVIISDKITEREMFKNSFLNKKATIEGQMEKINKASKTLDDIIKERNEMYRPKTDAEIKAKFEKQNKEALERLKAKKEREATEKQFNKDIEEAGGMEEFLRKNPIDDDTGDFAKGGRIGFRVGKFVLDKVIARLLGDPKKVKQAADDIFPTGDYKYDAQMAAEALVENNPRIFKNRLYDDLDIDTQIEIYGAVLEPIQKNMSIARQLKKASRPEKTLAAMKEGKGIDMSDPKIADEFTRFMKETDPEGSKTIEQTVELANFDPKGRKKNATGGRAGYYTGGITDVEPSLDDIGHGAEAMNSRTRLMSPGNQATTSTGLNYLLAEDNDNMRIPFSAGGGGRRAFLKLLATLGGATAAAKSGIIGLGEGTTKKAITETVKQSAGSTYPPPYFFKLVDKIKFMGDDTLATKDKAIAKKYKDYTMEEDFAGNIEIIKKGDNVSEDVFMSLKVDEVPIKGKNKSTKVQEYEEYTARPDAEGKMKNIEQGVPDEVIDEAGDTTAMTLKKADGGRIGFKLGGSGKKFIEKIFGKGSLDVMKTRDPELHKGMLEVVEMFRNRDKEGLKIYLQKFLPHMDDETIEAFIVGDAADAAGQGKYGLDNIQGQLIRLGSGRDYAGKIKMVKEAENMRALDKLDVTDRKPNSSGGIQTMLGE
jgi:hypothetical protein